ncbi:DNA adenine methylase [Salinicoccus roseus]|uniref:DNA adenine methylase n=1 Tax=Salinicoccus roseus TaxID=45670 RepID=UPI002300AE8E|nr:DNA adenine methylase [Salinicoccus roseus]
MNPSPLRYPGGKYKMYGYIKELVKNNNANTYIETFCGGSGLALELLLNGDVKKIILNDYDYSIYCFWYCVLNKPERLTEMIRSTPINLEEWFRQKKVREDIYDYSIEEVAFSTLYLNRTNRSGIIDKAGPIGGYQQNGNYLIDCRFNKEVLIKKILIISSKREDIKLFNLEALDFIDEVIKKEKGGFTFFDPPYFEKGKGLYTNFYSLGDHKSLSSKILKELKNKKWIVTYDLAPEILEMYRNVESIKFSLSYTLQAKKKGAEFLFFSKKIKRIDEENHLMLLEG